MLHQHRHEAFVRAVDGAVNHDWPVRLAVLADVLQLEALRHLEIQLRGVELPGATKSVLDIDIDLWTVERPLAWLHFVLELVLFERCLKIRLGALPHGRIADGLVGSRAQVVARLESEHVIDRLLELEHAADLGLDLIWSTEDVGVVHRQLPHPQQAVQRPGALVAKQPIRLRETQRQVAVAARLEAEDERGLGAVHRFERVVFILDFELEHALFVEVPVAGLLPQVGLDQRRRADLQIATAIQLAL